MAHGPGSGPSREHGDSAEARLPLDVDTLWARRGRRARRAHGRGHLGRALLGAALVLAILAGSAAATLMLVVRDPGIVVPCNLASTPSQGVGSDSFVYASDGSRLGTVPTSRNREPVALSQMSPGCRWRPWRSRIAASGTTARSTAEGITRAALADLRAGHVVQGASTITQQLVRDRYFGGRRVTLQPEARGGVSRRPARAARVQAPDPAGLPQPGLLRQSGLRRGGGGRTYFSRPAATSTLAQAALLAGLPQAPSVLRPARATRAPRSRAGTRCSPRCRGGGRIRRAGSRGRGETAAAAPLRPLRPGREPTFFGFALRELTRS